MYTRRQNSSSQLELESEELVSLSSSHSFRDKNHQHNDSDNDDNDICYSVQQRSRSNSSRRWKKDDDVPPPPTTPFPTFQLKSRLRQWVWGVCGIVAVAVLLNLNEIPFTKASSSSKASSLLKKSERNTNLPNARPTKGTNPPADILLDSDGKLHLPSSSTSSPTETIETDATTKTTIPGSQTIRPKPPYSQHIIAAQKQEQQLQQQPLTPYQYALEPPPPKTNVSSHFVRRWCDLRTRGGKEIEWYPTGDHTWQRRAPAFLIPGAKYSGVAALARALSGHAQIAAPRQSQDLRFFLQSNFRRYVTPSTEVTQVYAARARLYAHHHFYPTPALQRDPNLVSFDATGGYLLYSTVTPRRIFCVAPWVKLIIVLQNPLERLVHHYQAALRQGLPQKRVSLQQWVANDLRLLKKLGFLNTTREYHGSTQEDEAWYEYQSKSVARGTGSPLGRSLYEIQLRQWLQAVLAIGKRPSDVVLLVRASDFRRHPTGYLQRILQFVGVNDTATAGMPSEEQWRQQILPQSNFAAPTAQLLKEYNVTQAYKKELQQLFRPYMQRLPAVLKHFGLRWAEPAAAVS